MINLKDIYMKLEFFVINYFEIYEDDYLFQNLAKIFDDA